MFKHLLFSGGIYHKPYLLLFAVVFVLAKQSTLADAAFPDPAPAGSITEVPASAQLMIEPLKQIDPLNSPYPVPWNWIMETYARFSSTHSSGLRYYRTPSLVSPNGKYAAYSRIQMQVQPQLYRSRVRSVMFLENLTTGQLQAIAAVSPLANNPFNGTPASQMPGVFSISIPVAWSQPPSERLLARQFEGLFSTSDASDYAVIWDRQQNRTTTVAPNGINYSHAVLLGWSQAHPDRVLFRAGELGDEHWPQWTVDSTGKTLLATGDRPMLFGHFVNHIWAGPQAYR